MQKPTPYVMPMKAQADWNGAESKAYLRSRGLPAHKAMLAPEAKRQVTEFISLTWRPA